MNKPVAIHALLIGINDWKFPDQIKSLRGCHNDVALIEQTLGRLFTTDETRVTKLHDAEATVEGIVSAFRKKLIEPAKEWHAANPDKAHQSPAFLFHFSGHGTQVMAPAGSKSSGLDETLCTYDMERGKVFGLRDWMLGELVDELTKYTDNATLILDCCHSGSGMRAVEENLVARQAEPDLSPPPADLIRRSVPSASRAGTNEDTGFRLSVSDRSVLLAACRSTQKAYEHTAIQPAGDRKPATESVHGAFTYSLSESLSLVYGSKVPTYDQLYRTACRFVSYKSRSQRPQCEGGRERVLFGSAIKPRDLWMSVRNHEHGRYEVDGGLCHGITIGSELTVFAPDARQSSETDSKRGSLRVVDSQAVRCFCEPLKSDVSFALDSPVAVSRLVPAETTRSLRLVGAAKQHQESIAQSTNDSLIHIAESGVSDLTLEGDENSYSLRDGEGRMLDELPSSVTSDALSRMVNRWSRYYAALEIHNSSVGPELADKIELKLLHAPSKNRLEPFPESPGMLTIPHGSPVRVQITNRSTTPLYVTLFSFTSGGEVQMLYPSDAGRGEMLAPNEPFTTSRYGMTIVDQRLHESIDSLKVIATKEQSDFSLLCVGRDPKPAESDPGTHRSFGSNKVPASLTGLLKAAASTNNDRDMIALDDDEDNTWVTAELTYQLVRPIDQTTVRVTGGTKQQLAESGIGVETPAGFNGELSVVSNTQEAHRSVDGNGEPSWLRRSRVLSLEPLSLHSSRSLGEDTWMLELTADAQSIQSIDSKSPLKLSLPSQLRDGESLTVIADNGGTPFVVGSSQLTSTEAIVNWLPNDASDNDDQATRSLGRKIKLYVMKKLGLNAPGVGLQVARFVTNDDRDANPARLDERCLETPNGEVRYGPIGAAKLSELKKVLLLVHGFQSDSVWMLDQINQLGTRNYDAILTFDYESYNTSLTESAKTLADALKSAGLKVDDQLEVNVIAHSVGSLVVRAMVELEGGHELVNRCLMMGPPNQGTELAKGMRLAMWGSTLLVGGTLTAPWIARTLANMLKGVVHDGNALLDLYPESELLQKLNANDGRPLVPYHVIAGAHPIAEANSLLEKTARVFWSGYSGALDFLFEDRHDMLVNVRSMATVRLGGDLDGKVQSDLVSSDHFSYLAAAQTQQHVQKFLN